MFGKKNKTEIAKDIVQNLIRIVASLRADNGFSVSAPEITTYLRDKAAPDLVNAIDGCDSLLAQLRGPAPMMNPEIVLNIREALAHEAKGRGVDVARSPLTIADFDMTPKEIDFSKP